ncbi:MAG: glycosyltransferase family 2 protein [Candidatus Aenigmarchaeota archaeon]|nr:glycosyltransferase family 2 protein [Candidatus Aenigmarchaeota archaeon]
MELAPILLFVYNRPWHTKQTLIALKQNELANQSDLFIYSDAPKSYKDIKKVKSVRESIKKVDGFKAVFITERTRNQGLAKSIISGVTEIVNKYGKTIVLEDDLVTSPYFLKFMNDALDKYVDNDNIASISGYVEPIYGLPENFFLKKGTSWGWATWKKLWDSFEKDGNRLFFEINRSKKKKQFDLDGTCFFYSMLQKQIDGKINSWAIRWYASNFINGKLHLIPGKSLVKNIGHDGSGTHCDKNRYHNSALSLDHEVNVVTIDIVENSHARKMISNFYKKMYSKKNIFKTKFKRLMELFQ